ncbi:Phospholipid/glycerol acyltransferase [Trinorchestia longiramus]|nr:Phospholipid/glycerol acyltransferase [Trinorchestia longiramus]
MLLKLFEFSQNRVHEKRKVRLPSVSLDESDLLEEIQQLSFSHPKYLGLPEDSGRGFHMGDILEYVRAGVSAIVEDAVLTNFVPEEPPCWNLLTRTNTRDYEFVGQRHGGLLGYFMTLLSRSSTHIWFDRSNSKDRSDVTRRLKEHAANPDLPPILIFPEGVCVNNTSVVQFKKGAFEVDSVIYPVAIRFDSRFGDAFWWQDAFFSYVLYMMTSWAIVCDVWYLPPVTRLPGETAIAFANRVKAAIAVKGGMSDVSIDGFLKANPPKADLKSKYQQEFAKHCIPVKVATSCTPVKVPQTPAVAQDSRTLLSSTPVKHHGPMVLDAQFEMQLADLADSAGSTAAHYDPFSVTSQGSPLTSYPTSPLFIKKNERISITPAQKDGTSPSPTTPADSVFTSTRESQDRVLELSDTAKDHTAPTSCDEEQLPTHGQEKLVSNAETDLRRRHSALLNDNDFEDVNSTVPLFNNFINSDQVRFSDS